MFVYTHIYIYTYICVFIHVMYVSISVCVYMCIYIYICRKSEGLPRQQDHSNKKQEASLPNFDSQYIKFIW